MLLLFCVVSIVFDLGVTYSHMLISAVPEYHCHLSVTAEKVFLLKRSFVRNLSGTDSHLKSRERVNTVLVINNIA